MDLNNNNLQLLIQLTWQNMINLKEVINGIDKIWLTQKVINGIQGYRYRDIDIDIETYIEPYRV